MKSRWRCEEERKVEQETVNLIFREVWYTYVIHVMVIRQLILKEITISVEVISSGIRIKERLWNRVGWIPCLLTG